MKKLTLLATLSLLSFASVAQADEVEKGAKAGMSIEEIKTKLTTGIDQRIQALQAAKTCISSATDHKALKECRKNMREEREERRNERKGMREKRRSERKS